MGRGRFLTGIVLGVVTLSGCGVTTAATGSTPVPGDRVPEPTSTSVARPAGAPALERPTADPTGPTFPLTIRRTGGIADFHDTVVLRSDGKLSVDTDQISGRTCSLGKDLSKSLLVALSTLRLGGGRSGTSPTQPEATDTSSNPITLTVTDVHNRPVDLSDPSLGQIHSQVAALVSDVTLTTPATTTCSSATNPTS